MLDHSSPKDPLMSSSSSSSLSKDDHEYEYESNDDDDIHHVPSDDKDDKDDDDPILGKTTTTTKEMTTKKKEKEWIRGVNIGGWLLAERFLTPYLFAINSCHMEGDLCWYPGQVLDPTDPAYEAYNISNICDPDRCLPIRPLRVKDGNTDYHPLHREWYMDYPIDEWTLGQAFETAEAAAAAAAAAAASSSRTGSSGIRTGTAASSSRSGISNGTTTTPTSTTNPTTTTDPNGPTTSSLAQSYMERHWDTFVTYHDLLKLKDAGVTHMRVPISYWIRRQEWDAAGKAGTLAAGFGAGHEPYITGGWRYFVRFANWVRDVGGMEIWADLHGAPGSQNAFDNSGRYGGGIDGGSTCEGWSDHPANVERTVDILTDLVEAMADEGLQDVVTGFGLLNEPFFDCDEGVVRNYYNQGLSIVRSALGPDTAVFVGDMFDAWKFNDGFWTDPIDHANTYLDSHPYHVFFEQGRAFTPRQHIAYTCRSNAQDVNSCCYQDHEHGSNTVPAVGISRLIGEWSAAYDVLPTALAPHIMKVIAATGQAPYLNRTLSKPRKDFLRNFVEAQMVTYESKDTGVSSGWLFWNFKVEGGAFAEWDFLRGIEEGWIPKLPPRTVASQDWYGTCYEIYNRTSDDYAAIVDEYPDPRTLDWNDYQGWDATDDFVMSDPNIPSFRYDKHPAQHGFNWELWHLLLPALIVLLGILFTLRHHVSTYCGSTCGRGRRDRGTYQELK